MVFDFSLFICLNPIVSLAKMSPSGMIADEVADADVMSFLYYAA